MLLFAAVVALTRGAEVHTAELAPTLQAVREDVGAPIAIVTPSRPQQRDVEELVGPDGYVFARAGSPSETDLVPLGVTCAVFVTRRGVGARSPWAATAVGDCSVQPVLVEPPPMAREFEHERQFRQGMTIATWGAAGLPAVAGAFVVVGYPVGVTQSPAAGAVLWSIAAGAAIAAPPTVAFGALSSARALRMSGVHVSRAAGHTALVLMGAAALAPLVNLDGVAVLCLMGSFVAGGAQMATNTRAYHNFEPEPGHAARFHVTPVPLVVDGTRGLALAGWF